LNAKVQDLASISLANNLPTILIEMESLVQQIYSFINPNVGTQMNTSSAPPAFNLTSSSSQSFPLLPSSLVTLFLTFPALRDWLRLIVIGGILETCRRCFFSVWSSVVDSFFITAQFKEEDSSYDWMMVWLSKQPSWSMSFPSPLKLISMT
jgi:mitochondrial chaperone BCS1